MKPFEFHKRYANVPLEKRFKILNITKGGIMSLAGVRREIVRLQDSIRPAQIEIDKLIDLATPFLLKVGGGK